MLKGRSSVREANRAAMLVDIAQGHIDHGELARAIPHLHKAHAVLVAVRGKAHASTVKVASLLAGTLLRLPGGKGVGAALELLTPLASVVRATCGFESAAYADVLNLLAGARFAHGDKDAAVDLHEQARDIQEVTVGKSCEAYAGTLNSLAAVLRSTGQRAEALDLHRKVMEIQKTLPGVANSLDYAATCNNIASLLYQGEQFDDALALYHEVRAIRQARLGPMHVEVGNACWQLYTAYDASGRIEEATECVKHAFTVFATVHGLKHPVTKMAATAVQKCGGDLPAILVSSS